MRIFYDVDTQNDFMNENGALYVPNAKKIKYKLKKLTKYALKENIPILGSVDRHFGTKKYKKWEVELQKNGGLFPNHCMDGTKGAEKITETKSNNERYVPNTLIDLISSPKKDNSKKSRIEAIVKNVQIFKKASKKDQQEELYANAMQIRTMNGLRFIKAFKNNDAKFLKEYFDADLEELKKEKISFTPTYFEKHSFNIFTNKRFGDLLDTIKINEAIVYGVATDYCVKAAVLGMQERGIQCYVVKDAIKGVYPKTTKLALEEMVQAGAKFVTTKEVLEDKI